MSARPIATTRSAAGIPTQRLAVWWLIASEIVIFGGVLGSYIMHRLAHGIWADYAANTNPWIGAFNTFVLLTSSLSAVLAHQAAEEPVRGHGEHAALHLLRLRVAARGPHHQPPALLQQHDVRAVVGHQPGEEVEQPLEHHLQGQALRQGQRGGAQRLGRAHVHGKPRRGKGRRRRAM